MDDETTVTDLAYQVAFKIAHRMLRTYWWFRRPVKGGILVAVWHLGKILIIRNSYRHEYTLPGGYPLAGESAAQAGSRELLEECGVYIPSADLQQVYRREFLFEHRRDDVVIVEADLSRRPHLRIDNREVCEARFADPDEVMRLEGVPHLADYLRERAARLAAGGE
jgi:ADP-ribose pyrophosphatase YjhB (NUDIX family)